MDKKFLVGFLFVTGWIAIYMYYPLHNSEKKYDNEVTLIYALHDLKELQCVDVKSIKKNEKIGEVSMRIEVKGDNVEDTFSRQSLMTNGWDIVNISSNSIEAEKKDYKMNIVTNKERGYIELSAK